MTQSIKDACLMMYKSIPMGYAGRRLLHTHSVSRRAFVHDGRRHNVRLSPNGQALIGTNIYLPNRLRPSQDQWRHSRRRRHGRNHLRDRRSRSVHGEVGRPK